MSEKIIRERKKTEGETVRRFLERMLLRMVKRWYFRQFPELRGQYKADRGHLLEAKMERIVGGSGVSKKDVEESMNRVGLVIYKKKGALENPTMIFFLSNVGKYSSIYASDEAVSLFRQMFPGLVGCFASVEEDVDEELNSENFEYIENIVIKSSEKQVLEGLASVLQEYFSVDSKIPVSQWI